MEELQSDKLVERLRSGDREAFNEVVRACHPAMYRLANRLVQHADDAQEVVQEAFLAAFQGIGTFEQRSSVRTWLMAITYRKAVDRLKARRTESWHISGRLEDADFWDRNKVVQNITEWSANPEQTFDSVRLSESLHEALKKVPAQSRAVFELRDLQGMSSREAAQVLDMSEGAVRVRLHRVRQFLMMELNDLFGRSGKTP